MHSPTLTTRCTLPDGRVLGFALQGDPAAPPVVYCHGWPGSRLEAALLPDPPAWLIAPDRPGYGLSSAQAEPSLLGWAADIAVLADRLRIGRFLVAGVSGGAPYALALASALPARVAAVALVNPVPPPDTVAASQGTVRQLFRLGRHPRLATGLLMAARVLARSRPALLAHLLLRHAPESDRAALTPARTEALLAGWREGLRQGIAGARDDARLLARPWGFALDRITVPVLLWHGDQDAVVPVGCVNAFMALPGLRLRIVADAGHYALPLGEGRAILAALASSL